MAPSSLLQPDTLSALQAGLAEALAHLDSTGPSGLDDGQRVDAIRALERLVCTATAAQASLAAELEQSRSTAHQVAHARRESPHRGQRHLALARIVRGELPHTWAAWRDGRVTEWQATLMARETACTSSRSLSVGAALTSRPAQKARPLPRRRMARTAGSVAAALSASSRASASGLSMALSLSGRLSVSVRTPASDVQTSVDVEGMAQANRMAALRT